MNNFRNPYVDPDSFRGKIYENYNNQTIPQDIHFSFNNQGGFDQKETQQSRKNNQSVKTKKQAIYINNQLENITDPKPVMFSPPVVDSIQKPLNENPIDELTINNNQSKNTESEKMDKKDVVSNLIEEFSHMLEANPSIHEAFTTLQEGKSESDTLLISDESTSIPENKLADEYTNNTGTENITENRVHIKNKKSEMLFAEFGSILDERNNDLISKGENIKSLKKNNETIDEKILSLFLESDELQEENRASDINEENIDTLNETNGPIEDKFLTILSESDEMQEENQGIYKYEEDIDKLNETKDHLENKFFNMLSESDELQEENQDFYMYEEDIEELNETDDHLEDKFLTILSVSDELLEERQDSHTNEEDINESKEPKDTIEDEYYNMLSGSKEMLEEKQDSLFTNLKEKKSDSTEALSNLRDTPLINDVVKKKTATVRMQVLLSRLETDIDIVETIEVLKDIENIVKVEWSIQSLDCKVVLPSKTVFLKGEFVADIEFSNKGLENRIQSMKVSIPWSQTSSINWLAVPDFPRSSQNEFMFQSHNEHNSSFHYESNHTFSEPIHSLLKQSDFIWYQELNSKDKHLHVNGVAQLSLHFVQEQYIELDCYSK